MGVASGISIQSSFGRTITLRFFLPVKGSLIRIAFERLYMVRPA